MRLPAKIKVPKKRTPKKQVAGRPATATLRGRGNRKHYVEILAEIGAVPKTRDPIVIACWAARIQARCMALTLTGKGDRELNQEIRAFANGIKRLIPLERQLEAERALKAAAAPQRPAAARGGRARKVKAPKKGAPKRR